MSEAPGETSKGSSKTFGGIAPLWRFFQLSELTLAPPGRIPPLYDCRARSCSMSAEYGRKTRELLALGRSVFDSHQTTLTASLTRMRSTLTHCAGSGIFEGLY